MKRPFIIHALIALNLGLLLGFLTLATELPTVHAQSRATGGGYVLATAEYTGGSDALYILHTGKGLLSVLLPESNQSGRLYGVAQRDVQVDLTR